MEINFIDYYDYDGSRLRDLVFAHKGLLYLTLAPCNGMLRFDPCEKGVQKIDKEAKFLKIRYSYR